VEQRDADDPRQSWLARLVAAIDHAASTGWSETLRMMVLLVVMALVLALIMMAMRQAWSTPIQL
jgi:hypothetical protein